MLEDIRPHEPMAEAPALDTSNVAVHLAFTTFCCALVCLNQVRRFC